MQSIFEPVRPGIDALSRRDATSPPPMALHSMRESASFPDVTSVELNSLTRSHFRIERESTMLFGVCQEDIFSVSSM